jgi:hypothetical protein
MISKMVPSDMVASLRKHSGTPERPLATGGRLVGFRTVPIAPHASSVTADEERGLMLKQLKERGPRWRGAEPGESDGRWRPPHSAGSEEDGLDLDNATELVKTHLR